MNKIRQLIEFGKDRLTLITMIILMLVSVFHYVFFYYQTYQANANINRVESMHKEVEWTAIEGVIDFASYQAKINADSVARRIVEDIEREYPDKSELSAEFERGMYYSPKLLNILSREVAGSVIYGNNHSHNDIFILTRNGIIMDNNVENHPAIHRSISEEIDKHYNQQLGYNAIADLLRNTNTDIVYYEPHGPYNSFDHMKVLSPTKEALHEVFNKEGLNGLRGYVMLVPAYITETGDIFGTPDIAEDGSVNLNYKIVVVQRYSVYDILENQALLKHNAHDVYDVAKAGYADMLKSSTVSYICITILDMIALCFLIIIITERDVKRNKK